MLKFQMAICIFCLQNLKYTLKVFRLVSLDYKVYKESEPKNTRFKTTETTIYFIN